MTKQHRPPPDALRKSRFREAARGIVYTDRLKRQGGQAVDTAGAIARAMEQAYRLGFEHASAPVVAPAPAGTDDHTSDAMTWSLIPPRTRTTFWNLCMAAAALHRMGGVGTPSYLTPEAARYGRIAWQLVVPGRPPDSNRIGNGTIVTLLRLGLLQRSSDESRITFTDYGIKTWNRFRERGGQFPEDLVDTFP